MHENPTPPVRPGALAGVPLHHPITRYEERLASHVRARLSLGAPEPIDRLLPDALHTLIRGQALASRHSANRRPTIAEALAYPVAHVDTALSPEIDEVAAGLRSWGRRTATARQHVRCCP